VRPRCCSIANPAIWIIAVQSQIQPLENWEKGWTKLHRMYRQQLGTIAGHFVVTSTGVFWVSQFRLQRSEWRGANFLGNQPTQRKMGVQRTPILSNNVSPCCEFTPRNSGVDLSSRAAGVMSPTPKNFGISGQTSQPFSLLLVVLLSRCSLVCLSCVVLIASNELFLGYPQCCRKPSDNRGFIPDSTSRKFHFSCNSLFLPNSSQLSLHHAE
jgi:hypothetical protein